MSFTISHFSALEILDSRSKPALQVTLGLEGGAVLSAGVPSGASTGTREAVELRDRDTARYSGAGVATAVANVNTEIAEHLTGRTLSTLAEADGAMKSLDGTPNKARLGANAIVGVSMALARSLAAAGGKPLHAWLPGFGQPARIPLPCFNVLNGGAHAPNPLDFQEFMVCPLSAPSMAEALRSGAEVYAALKKRLAAGGTPPGSVMRAALRRTWPSRRRCWR